MEGILFCFKCNCLDFSRHKERAFKDIQLKNIDDKPDQNTQTQLTPTPNTTDTTEKYNCQKNLSSATEKITMSKKRWYLLCPLNTAI
jgi:hypothetical protein